jgi:hypothetical protein
VNDPRWVDILVLVTERRQGDDDMIVSPGPISCSRSGGPDGGSRDPNAVRVTMAAQ